MHRRRRAHPLRSDRHRREEQVDALARRAVEAFGRIEIWVNGAAVLAFGRVEDILGEDLQRLVRTNLFGYVFCGTWAALRQFCKRREGVLINISSVLGSVAAPYVAAYCGTKWAIRGMTESVPQRAGLLTEAHGQSGAQAGAQATPRAGGGRLRLPATIGHALFPALTERITTAYIARRQFKHAQRVGDTPRQRSEKDDPRGPRARRQRAAGVGPAGEVVIGTLLAAVGAATHRLWRR